eukprot:SM000197S05460  [mRNA]  locus=s197:215652:223016:+ [translate_table: standard]
MWSLWRPRDRFSLDELRHLNEQLHKYAVINDANKGVVVETLRSIAELMIWGDQHEPAFFEFFMDQKLLSHFLRILKSSSKRGGVAVQLLQTLSIMIQNIKSQVAIYYLFSNEYINNIITYPFDFTDEELLAYYISFLRTVSMKLEKQTVSFFLLQTPEGGSAFPLYTEAIKFFHHEETMVRIAVRTLTLNIYSTQDEAVQQFVVSPPAVGYFSDLVNFLRQQALTLDSLVLEAARGQASSQSIDRLEAAIAEVGDLLYYCNDIMCSNNGNLVALLAKHMLDILIRPVLLGSLDLPHVSISSTGNVGQISPLCGMYLLSRLLHIVIHKPLLDAMVTALLSTHTAPRRAGHSQEQSSSSTMVELPFRRQVSNAQSQSPAKAASQSTFEAEKLKPDDGQSALSSETDHIDGPATEGLMHEEEKARAGVDLDTKCSQDASTSGSSREAILSFLQGGDNRLIMAALCVLVSLLQNEAMDDGLLDALGILPRKKRHKQLLLVRVHCHLDFDAGIHLLVLLKGITQECEQVLRGLRIVQALISSQTDEELRQFFATPPEEDSSLQLRQGFALSRLDSQKRAEHSFAEAERDPSGDDADDRQSSGQPSHDCSDHDHAQAEASRDRSCRAQNGDLPSVAASHAQQTKQAQEPSKSQHMCQQVVDCLLTLFCRRPPPWAEALWHAGWLLRQLLPENEYKLCRVRQELLEAAFSAARDCVLREVDSCWCDILPSAVRDEWKICRKALQAPSLQRDSSFVLLPSSSSLLSGDGESSAALGDQMRSNVKVFVALHQMRLLLLHRTVPDEPPSMDITPAPTAARTGRAGISLEHVQEGSELLLVAGDAMACRVAFERGKERAVYLQVASSGCAGWLLLSEPAPTRLGYGVVRVIAPLAGCSPRIDEKHNRWLHLRIRSPQIPSPNTGTLGASAAVAQSRASWLADGRWTLAFADEQRARQALTAVAEEIAIQSQAVREILSPLLDNSANNHGPKSSAQPSRYQ